MAEHGILDIDDDTLFEFIGKLPVTKTFYDGQFRIHPTEAGQQTVLRFLGKTYEPIATIVMDNSDGNKEICTYVKSEDNSSKKKVLGLFVGGIAKSYEYALLNCACIFMFGATERTKFPLQMFSTSALQTKYPMPSLSFVREMAKCQPTALHSSVWVSKEISPFVTTLSRFLGMCTFGTTVLNLFPFEIHFNIYFLPCQPGFTSSQMPAFCLLVSNVLFFEPILFAYSRFTTGPLLQKWLVVNYFRFLCQRPIFYCQ